MDKKNLLIGVLLLAAAASVIFYFGPKAAQHDKPASQPPAATASAVTGQPEAPATHVSGSQSVYSAANPTLVAATVERAEAQFVTLSNDYIEARFTNYGGAIRDIAFKKYPAVQGASAPFIFNEQHAHAIFAFTSDAFTAGKLDRTVPYTLVSQSATEVVFRTIYENTIEVTRRYIIVPTGAAKEAGDPYRIRHEVTFRNLTDQAKPLPAFSFNIGTAGPSSDHENAMYVTSGYNNGDKSEFIERSKLAGSAGFLGMGASNPVSYIDSPGKTVWASISNQFFSGILTPDNPGRGIITQRVDLPPLGGSVMPSVGITVNVSFDTPALAPNGESKLGFEYYAGPKEYTRIKNFTKSEDEVMQYGRYFFNRIMFSGAIAPFMNWLMNLMHGFVGQWGIAIICMTLLLKFVTLPFTLAASRSAKRMQKIQPEMQALREKYKDNPQKMNQATMELFKKNRVNPMGGCLPILITMPLFVAFFVMLQSTAELRFQSFLWAKDLSAPDTIARLNLGFMILPINIMPLLMGATMFFQMRLTPSPTVDNAQAKMMKFMPVIFTFFCYNFSCALALYSTINGLFTICQQLVINRMKEKEPVAATATGPSSGNRNMKNVTPAKKK